MNEALQTVLVAPMTMTTTTTLRNDPTRVSLTFRNKTGQVALDQLRAIDRQRLVRTLGLASTKTVHQVADVLTAMFVR